MIELVGVVSCATNFHSEYDWICQKPTLKDLSIVKDPPPVDSCALFSFVLIGELEGKFYHRTWIPMIFLQTNDFKSLGMMIETHAQEMRELHVAYVQELQAGHKDGNS